MVKLSKIISDADELCGIVQRHIEQGSFTSIQDYLMGLTRLELEVLTASLLVITYDLATSAKSM